MVTASKALGPASQRLAARSKAATAALLVFLGAGWACNPLAGRGGSGADGDGEVDSEEPSSDEPLIEEGQPSEELTGTYLVGIDNARARCDFRDDSDSRYVLDCRAVISLDDGREVVAQGIRPGTTLTWADPIALDGRISDVACDVAADRLSQSCELTAKTATARVKVELDVHDKKMDESRLEQSIVLLPYSVGVSAGFVPAIPILYQPGSATGADAKGLSLAKTPATGGFQTAPFEADRVPLDISALCVQGDDIYFARAQQIFKLTGSQITLHAGHSTAMQGGTSLDRLRVAFGKVTGLVCGDSRDDVIATFLDQTTGKSRIASIPPTGQVVIIGESVDGGEDAGWPATIVGKLVRDHLPSVIDSLTLSSSGEIYFATYNHIYRIDDGGRLRAVAMDIPLPTDAESHFSSLLVAADGSLRVTTNGGLYDLVGKEVKLLAGGMRLEGYEPAVSGACPEIGTKVGAQWPIIAARAFGKGVVVIVHEGCLAHLDADLVVKGLGRIGWSGAFATVGTEAVIYQNESSSTIERWTFQGEPVTLAGVNQALATDGSPATSVHMQRPQAIAYDGDLLIVSDDGQEGLLAVDTAGKLRHHRGRSTNGGDDLWDESYVVVADGIEAEVGGEPFVPYTSRLAVGPDGTYFMSSYGNLYIRKPGGQKTRVVDGTIQGDVAVGPKNEAYVTSAAGIMEVSATGVRRLLDLGQEATSVAVAPSGELLWSTAAQIYRRAADGTVKALRLPASIPEDSESIVSGMAVANDGTIYFHLEADGKLRTLTPPSGDGPWAEDVVFGSESTPLDCGAGKVTGKAAAQDLEGALKASVSLVCAGSVGGAVAIKDTCPEAGGSTRVAFTQLFAFGGNVVEFVLPCRP